MNATGTQESRKTKKKERTTQDSLTFSIVSQTSIIGSERRGGKLNFSPFVLLADTECSPSGRVPRFHIVDSFVQTTCTSVECVLLLWIRSFSAHARVLGKDCDERSPICRAHLQGSLLIVLEYDSPNHKSQFSIVLNYLQSYTDHLPGTQTSILNVSEEEEVRNDEGENGR